MNVEMFVKHCSVIDCIRYYSLILLDLKFLLQKSVTASRYNHFIIFIIFHYNLSFQYDKSCNILEPMVWLVTLDVILIEPLVNSGFIWIYQLHLHARWESELQCSFRCNGKGNYFLIDLYYRTNCWFSYESLLNIALCYLYQEIHPVF